MTNNQHEDSDFEHALLFAGIRLRDFINFISSDVDPELNEVEATLLAAIMLENFPRLINERKELLTALKNTAESIKSQK